MRNFDELRHLNVDKQTDEFQMKKTTQNALNSLTNLTDIFHDILKFTKNEKLKKLNVNLYLNHTVL